jgi:hypothetical protein
MTEAPAAPPLSPLAPASGAEAWDELSPDGLTLVRWAVSHGRMSHVIITPHLLDAATHKPILILDDGYDAQIGWADEGRFTMSLRHYWRGGGALLEVDRKADRFRFTDDGAEEEWQPLAGIGSAVNARFSSIAAAAQAVGLSRPRFSRRRIAAIVILLGIAAAAVWLPL